MAADENTAGGARSGGLAPYRILNTGRRRRAGHVYVGFAILCGVVAWGTDVTLLWLTGVLPLGVLALVQYIGAWKMSVTDMQAIEIASGAASFDVGHGSATLGYRGILAKPVWQVLIYANTPSPDREALITVDAMSGAVTGHFEQDVDVP